MACTITLQLWCMLPIVSDIFNILYISGNEAMFVVHKALQYKE